MASSKSTIKRVLKTQLYFNKYRYKATVSTTGIYWVRSAKTLADFTTLVQDRYNEWDQHKGRYPYGWYREPEKVENHDLKLIEEVIDIRNSLIGADVRFRNEYDTFSIYTNDAILIQKLSSNKNWKFEEVEASPAGVKYFKKDPPAKFRTYLTSNKVDQSFIPEMIDYLDRTTDMNASDALYTWLKRGRKNTYSYCWLSSYFYVDYDDEKNLMMMHLMFPGAIGKTYKLEKKS